MGVHKREVDWTGRLGLETTLGNISQRGRFQANCPPDESIIRRETRCGRT